MGRCTEYRYFKRQSTKFFFVAIVTFFLKKKEEILEASINIYFYNFFTDFYILNSFRP